MAYAHESAPVEYAGGLEDQARVLAELIRIYAVGILRGDGVGIRSWK